MMEGWTDGAQMKIQVESVLSKRIERFGWSLAGGHFTSHEIVDGVGPFLYQATAVLTFINLD